MVWWLGTGRYCTAASHDIAMVWDAGWYKYAAFLCLS
jgi:hypothetical protein